MRKYNFNEVTILWKSATGVERYGGWKFLSGSAHPLIIILCFDMLLFPQHAG